MSIAIALFIAMIMGLFALNISHITKGLEEEFIIQVSLKPSINEEEVTAYKLKEASDYALIYGMNTDTGEENLYIYDRVEHTVVRYNDEEANIYKKLANDYFLYLICLVIGVSLGILVITIISILRHKKKNKFKLYS